MLFPNGGADAIVSSDVLPLDLSDVEAFGPKSEESGMLIEEGLNRAVRSCIVRQGVLNGFTAALRTCEEPVSGSNEAGASEEVVVRNPDTGNALFDYGNRSGFGWREFGLAGDSGPAFIEIRHRLMVVFFKGMREVSEKENCGNKEKRQPFHR